MAVRHELMRFTGLDTARLLRDPGQQMGYGYVSGNPLKWGDILGLCEPEGAGFKVSDDFKPPVVDGKRYFDSQPAGPNGPQLTFNNNDLGGSSTDRMVDEDLASAVENAAIRAGIRSLNISSTTGGIHDEGSAHYEGRAADINRIDDLRLDNANNEDAVRKM